MLAVVSDVAAVGESSKGTAAAAELAVLRLLQGAARTPEELLSSAVELLLLGLLKKQTFTELCTSLGLRGEALNSLLGRMDAAAELAGLSGGGGGGGSSGGGIGMSIVPHVGSSQKRIAELAAQVAAASLPAGVGLGSLGLQSRLAAEFVLLRKLGQGGMGSVFLAKHQLDGNHYAIKIVPFWVDGRGEHQQAAERVLREVQALSRLNHPHVCRYYHAWVETDWASLWRSQSAPSHSSSVSRLPLLEAASTPHTPHRQMQRLTQPALQHPGSPSSEAEGFSSDECSSPGGQSPSRPTWGHSCSSEPSFGGSSDFFSDPSAPRGPPPLGRQWSYRKALLIQMEWCEGQTLRDFLRARDSDGHPVRGFESLDLLMQICSGLEHVHACGLVHRDLKPDNCCFSGSWSRPAAADAPQGALLKLTDFGLARQSVPTEDTSESDAVPPTDGGTASDGSPSLAGLVPEQIRENRPGAPPRARQAHGAKPKPVLSSLGVGTAAYSAPEQLNQGMALPACDMFPLGLIGFELFHAFGSSMERAKVFSQLRSERLPRDFTKDWPRLAKLIRRLLSLESNRRPLCSAVMRELRDLERAWVEEEPPICASPPASASPPACASPPSTRISLPVSLSDDSFNGSSSPLLPKPSSPSLQLPTMPPLQLLPTAVEQPRSTSRWTGFPGCDTEKPASPPMSPPLRTTSGFPTRVSTASVEGMGAALAARDETIARLKAELKLLAEELNRIEG